MRSKKTKVICSIIAFVCITPIMSIFVIWAGQEIVYPKISFDNYNGRSYYELGASSIYTFTPDKKIGRTESGCDVYTIKYDDRNDFLYCTGYRMHYLMTALDYTYEDMDYIRQNGMVTHYKIIKDFERSFFYGNEQKMIDAIAKLDDNQELLEAVGDYTKDDIGSFMYTVELCFDNMPVSLHNQKGITIDAEKNQAYYLPERYADGDDRTIYKVLDEDIKQLFIDIINNAEFEETD